LINLSKIPKYPCGSLVCEIIACLAEERRELHLLDALELGLPRVTDFSTWDNYEDARA
jgi:hypothetical protein